jgi:hypothetical protein
MPPEDDKQQTIEAIHARLAQQERRTIVIVALLLSFVLALDGLLFFHVLEIP